MKNRDCETDKRIIRTKEDLKKALLLLLNQSPFDTITITDIIKQAGYSRTTFYSHYKDKEDFMNQIIFEEIRALIALMIDKVKLASNDIERFIPDITAGFFQYVYDNYELYRYIFSVNPQKFIAYYYDITYQEIKRNLVIEKTADALAIDIEIYNYLYTRLYLAAVEFWVKSDFKQSPNYMAKQLVLFFTRTPSKAKKENNKFVLL